MKRLLSVLMVLFLYAPVSQAQNFMTYEGEKVNEIDANGKKVGIWKLFNPGAEALVIGKVYDNTRLDGAAYFYRGKLFAKQYNDSVFDIAEKGELVRVQIHHLEEYLDRFLAVHQKKDTFQLSDYERYFKRANGEPFDPKLARFFENLALSMPLFYDNLEHFLSDFIRFSPEMRKGGRIEVQFVIQPDGKVMYPKVLKTANEKLIDQTIKMVSKMPRWQPALLYGRFIPFTFTMPINFAEINVHNY